MAVQSLDLGFDADRVATAEIVLSQDEFPSGQERRAFMEEAVGVVAALPAVREASAVNWLPLNHETISSQVAPSSLAGAPEDEWPLAVSNFVMPGYFETMSIELLTGRDFARSDEAGGQAVVIVNRALANRFWPGEDAVGQTLLVGDPADPATATVVGVAGDVQHADLDPGSVGPQIYRPSLQAGSRRFFVLAATEADPADLVPSIRTSLASIAPDLPVTIRPMEDVVSENQLQWSLSSVFLGIFGSGALLLATLGIYGLVSYSAAQREREIGVRIALGATVGEIRRSVVVDGLRLTGIGIAVGVVAAAAIGQAIAAMLYGVPPFDPITLGAVVVLFAGVSALASFLPAARASKTDPIAVLRAE
jgi:predicted permease